MAKRRRSRVYTRVKRVYSSRKGTNFKPIVNGLMAGIAAEAGQKVLGKYGVPLGVGVVGYLMKDNTLKTIAGMQAGSVIGDMLPVIGGGGSAIGGVY